MCINTQAHTFTYMYTHSREERGREKENVRKKEVGSIRTPIIAGTKTFELEIETQYSLSP